MFVDEVVIKARAGDGGRGCISFRREKYEPWGGPNGGDGGKGGDVVLVGDDDQNNLVDYRFRRHWEGKRGEHGRGSDQHGRAGAPAILRVPLGTVVTREDTGEFVGEIVRDGQELILCRGGNGGWGNLRFKSSTNRAPRRANPGQPGEEGTFRLVLKSIADVGLVGFPNAGKSTLTRRLTQARPRTAAYPFTTLQPQVGVIEFADTYERLLLADVPGLIEGASEDRGLGHRFLRHIERCAVLLLLVDMAGVDGRDPRDDYAHLLRELELYDPALLEKPRLVAANKMDLPAAAEWLRKFRRRHKVEIVRISGLEGQGLEDLKHLLRERVHSRRAELAAASTKPSVSAAGPSEPTG